MKEREKEKVEKKGKKGKDETIGEALIELTKTLIEQNKQKIKLGQDLLNATNRNHEILTSLQTGTAIAQSDKGINPYERVERLFPDDIRAKLNLSIEGNEWVARPRHYLGTEDFAKTASIVRELGGRYVSAGKESHFRGPAVPK